MSARFEVVRGNAKQPWHGRLVVNGRTTWVTETHTRQVGVERAIISLLREAAGVVGVVGVRWNVEGREKFFAGTFGQPIPALPLIRYVDERGEES